MKALFRILLLLVVLLPATVLHGQKGSFLDQLRIGFGVGANASHLLSLEAYNVYENLAGENYLNEYSPFWENMGNQYFVQLEWYIPSLVVALKPGTYTYRFSRLGELDFSEESLEQETPVLLRYIGIPLELRYNLDMQRFRPYAGISLSYSHLLGSHDASNNSFIRPLFSGGVVAGTYIDLRYVILDLNAGYLTAFHNTASKTDRFGSGSGQTFAQDDLLLNKLQLSLSLLFSLQKQRHSGAIECYY